MAKYITTSNGLVTRFENTLEGLPLVTESDDPWIRVDGLIQIPEVGDHTDDEGLTFTYDHTNLSKAQAARIAVMRDACGYHIKKKGFVVGHTSSLPETSISTVVYPSKPNDQANIEQVGGAARANPNDTYSLMCAVAPTQGEQWVQTSSDWMFRDHTAAQIAQVERNLHLHIQAAREYLTDRVSEILAATTVNDVNAVSWISPPN